MTRPGDKIAFFVTFDHNETKSVAACYERAERAGGSFASDEPSRGFQLLTSEAFLEHSRVRSGAE